MCRRRGSCRWRVPACKHGSSSGRSDGEGAAAMQGARFAASRHARVLANARRHARAQPPTPRAAGRRRLAFDALAPKRLMKPSSRSISMRCASASEGRGAQGSTRKHKGGREGARPWAPAGREAEQSAASRMQSTGAPLPEGLLGLPAPHLPRPPDPAPAPPPRPAPAIICASRSARCTRNFLKLPT